MFLSYSSTTKLINIVRYNSVTNTFQPYQWVKAPLLFTGKEAVTIQKVGPGHFDAFKGMNAVLPQCFACTATGFDHLVILAGRGEHRAANEAYLWGALPVEQAMDDTQEEILWS